ncbi:MAG: amidohydrolase family protein [Planctomycetota bacterium]
MSGDPGPEEGGPEEGGPEEGGPEEGGPEEGGPEEGGPKEGGPEGATEQELPGAAEAGAAEEAGAEAPARRPRLTRRKLLGLFALGGALGLGLRRLVRIDPPVPVAEVTLSDPARALVDAALAGLARERVIDSHVHLIGLGVGGTGCFVHPDATSLTSPVRWVKTRFYKGAAGIYDDERADPLFVERLVDLARHAYGRFLLLAFDKHYTADGRPDLDRTEFHTPNDYLLRVTAEHPDLFLPCASVHPYRPDALDELSRVKERGAIAIKWLPNAMGMDPLDPRCDAYYERMRELSLVLISHGGEEQAVHAEEAQELGNPLRLRRALDAGVRVVVAHCASLGSARDLDAAPDAAGERPKESCYELWRRLITDPRYRGRVYGDVSAMTQFNRCGRPLRETLRDERLRGALLNGSDYPLPAIDPLVRTGLLVDEGYLPAEERDPINEVYARDPLLFDLVLKRRLRVVEDGVEHRLPPQVFETAAALGVV